MNIQEYITLLGKSVNHPDTIGFLEKNGYPYPKKDTISNRAENRSYWISAKTENPDLLCSIDIKNPNYKSVPAGRKGMYYPVIVKILFDNKKVAIEFPFSLDFSLDYEQSRKIMGEPVVIHSLFGYHIFEKPIDRQKDIFCSVVFNEPEKEIQEISLFIKEEKVLFYLYDELDSENFATYREHLNNRNIAEAMFVRWAIEQDLITKTPLNNESLQRIKNGKTSVFDYLESLQKGYVSCEDFSADCQPVYNYIHNLYQDKGYYYGDFAQLFLADEKLQGNYLGAAAQSVLDKFVFSEKNYLKVKQMLDRKNFC